jgi:hypothetical protein
MAQAVSRRPVAAEAQVRTLVSPCGICDGKVALEQVFPNYTVLPCQYHCYHVGDK